MVDWSQFSWWYVPSLLTLLTFHSFNWANARENLQEDLCDQQRLRSACTSTQYVKGSCLSLFR